MKKIFIVTALIIGLCSVAHAGRVTKPYTFSSGQTIRSADVNSNFDTIYSEFNGSIEGGASGNIAADSLTETEMADDVNPRIRWDEGFQDWVYTGLLPADSANLTSDISAGTAYVSGYRVSKASATSKTYTATKDTYVDIDYTGVFHYTEVARLAAEPAVYASSIRLAAVASDGSEILQVTDMRVLTPYSTGSSKDMITRGFELVWASTTTVTVNPGTLYVNVTQVDNTSTTTLDITAAGDAIDGVAVQGTSKWVYIYVDNAGNCKLYATAPNYADTSNNTDGTKLYYLYSSTWYRCIGAIRLNSTGSGEIINFYQCGDRVTYDDVIGDANLLVLNAGSQTSFTAVSCATCVPAISTLIDFDIFPAGVQDFYLRATGSSATNGYRQTMGASIYTLINNIPSNSAQSVDYKVGTSNITMYVKGYKLNIR